MENSKIQQDTRKIATKNLTMSRQDFQKSPTAKAELQAVGGMTPQDVQTLKSMFRNRFKQDSDSKSYNDDFANFYKGSDDIYGNATGTQVDSQALAEYGFLCQRRLGVGYNVTHGFSEDALFNWFDPVKQNVPSNKSRQVVIVPGHKKWVKDTDFKNQAILWNAHRYIYGIGLLVKFWSVNDINHMHEPAPRGPPRKFQVISPEYLAPYNVSQTRMIDYDPDVWKFSGGNLRHASIHPSRIEVLRGKPVQNTYRGLSVIDPIYLSLICYFNGLIYLTRGLAKVGTVTPVIKTASRVPKLDEYEEYLDLAEQYVMNNIFVVGKDDQVEFPATKLGDGIYNIMEIMKEDMASGVRIPLNYLFMRSESVGIGGSNALTAERKILNRFATAQANITDDFLRIFEKAGFDFDDLDLGWNLSIMKTREQELAEQRMELDNDMATEQVKMAREQRKMLKMQQELFNENKDLLTPEQKLDGAEQIKEDFVYAEERLQKYQRLQQFLRLKPGDVKQL